MPLYEYITTDSEKGCRICQKGFELRRPVSRPPLEACPLCRNPVKKLVSKSVASPKITKPLSVSDAKKAGFTVLEKRDRGTYEKL
jgi:putative FmdB family regulatory protein